jgi:ribokinase
MARRPRIVVLGSLVFDFVARAPRLPSAGETLLGDMFGMFPGGKGANQAVQAGRLGAEVFMIGRVGTDFLGERLLASLQESGVNTRFVTQDSALQTAACCIHVDAAARNSIVVVPQANAACGEEDVNAAADVISAADILLCQLEIPVATVAYAARLAAGNRVPVILNPAPAQPLDRALLSTVTYLTPNESEAELLTGTCLKHVSGAKEIDSTVRQAGAKLLADGVGTAIITLAENGAYFTSVEREALVPGFQVDAVDTTAAGDAFNGALAVALAEGRRLEEAILQANAAGALATTKVGAQPSLSSRADIERLLDKPPRLA